MNARLRALVLLAVVMSAAALYIAQLNRAPIYLNDDETEFALQAHAIATTARDDEGRLLPLYFHVTGDSWFHPALVYAMAPVLAVVRPMPWAVRLPTALLAIGNILLVYFVARRVGASDVAAIGASVLLALTPAHVLHGRIACDYLFPVPWVLLWLLLFAGDDVSRTPWRLFAAACALGLGLYTYIAAIVMMPVYLLLTYVVLFVTGVRRLRPYAIATAGFVLPMLPLVGWLIAVPQVFAGFAHRYQDANAMLRDPFAMFRLKVMAERWAVYKSFYEWTFLFDRAETHVVSSTYRTGIFLKGMMVLLPLGAYHILRNRRTPFTVLILAGFFTAPLAASLIPEPHTIDRALVLVPMGALVGAFGIDWLLARRVWLAEWAGRAVCVGLGIWMLVQFEGFYRDYLTDYRVRSAQWFHGNHPGAFEPIRMQSPPGDPRTIYLNADLPWIYAHWKVYLVEHRRTDLLARTVYFTVKDLHLKDVGSGSLLLTGEGDSGERALLNAGGVRPVSRVLEPDGSPGFTLFERTQETISYPFDGTYPASVSFTCTEGTKGLTKAACASLPTTVACPSMEVVTVSNGTATDYCGYLSQAALSPDGAYAGVSPTYGFPITGTFNAAGTFQLSGAGASGGNQYEISLLSTKR